MKIDRTISGVDQWVEIGREVIAIQAEGLARLGESLNAAFAQAVGEIVGCKQRVIVSGMGKSGHVARKIAATLAATGTPAHFLHAAEAAHGDAGMVMAGDVLLVFSNSGDTVELHPLYAHAERLGVTLIGVSRNPASLLMRRASVGLLLPQVPEACIASMAPTTSSTMMIALGDALAVAAMRARGLTGDDIRALHPGGDIGRRFRRVVDVMHSGDRLPLVDACAPMPEVLATMTQKGLGMTGVVGEDGALMGIITDGDLRRHAGGAAADRACDIMTPSPKVIEQMATIDDALEMMRTYRVAVLFVVSGPDSSAPVGAVQIYDIAAAPGVGR